MVISVISLQSLRNYGGTVFNMNIQNSGDIMKGIVQCTCLIDNVWDILCVNSYDISLFMTNVDYFWYTKWSESLQRGETG